QSQFIAPLSRLPALECRAAKLLIFGEIALMKREYLSRLPQFVFHRRPWFIVLFQAAVVSSAVVLAWLLRFDFSLPYRRTLLLSGAVLVVVRLLALRLFALNRGWWDFPGRFMYSKPS